MKAMIFAAGMGTRLGEFTTDRPKAMVEINGKPMIGHLLHRLAKYGITSFVVNVHHFADMLCDYLKSPEFNDYHIEISDERGELLETGGGLLKARDLLLGDSDVLVHNVDVFSDIDYQRFFNYHRQYKPLASMAVSRRDTSRYLLFNAKNELIGWQNVKEEKMRMSRLEVFENSLAFSGIHIVSQEFLHQIQGQGAFSIIDTYLQFAQTQQILAYEHTGNYWIDLGKPQAISQLEADFKNHIVV